MRGIIASQLEGRLTTNAGLGIKRERGEAIQLLKNPEIGVGAFDGIKAAEVLVVLIEAADDEFSVVVGGRD